LLDNFHIVLASLRDIHHDLPPSFFRRLPRIAADEFAGLPRIYAMALELIRCGAGRLDPQRLQRFLTAFQTISPLTMGELWAWPSALKLALIEHLRNRVDVLAISRAERLQADRLVDSLDGPARAATAGRRRCIRRSSYGCCNALESEKALRSCGGSWMRRWRRAARRLKTRFVQKHAIRRPNKPSSPA
jgi:Ser/Thr protein kinase RdoA (MazF antagonist)